MSEFTQAVSGWETFYMYVLMIAILFMVPGQSPLGLGLPLLAVGGLGSVNTISQQRRARKVQHSALHPDIAQRFTGPLISMSLLTICAAGLLFGMLWSLLGLVVVVILLLASASQNAWTLLVVVGRQES